MIDFTFPQPGELQNASAVPVPEPILLALLAGALAWEIDTDAAYPGTTEPQLREATLYVLSVLNEEMSGTASRAAQRLMHDRMAAEAEA